MHFSASVARLLTTGRRGMMARPLFGHVSPTMHGTLPCVAPLRHSSSGASPSSSSSSTTAAAAAAQVDSFLSDLHARGIIFQHTEGIKEALLPASSTGKMDSGGRVRVYAGFDPTADGLHVGNLCVLMTLKRFLQLDFVDVVALVGGGTGLIGDPSGRKTERPLLTLEQVQHNVQGIRSEVTRLLEMDSNDGGSGGRVTVVNNHDWLSKINFIELLRDYGKLFQMNQMLRLESVRSRLSDSDDDGSGSGGMTFTEFSYVVFQSYDFHYLHKEHGVSVQIGGSDQWGNIISGIDLIKKKHNADAAAASGSASQTQAPRVGGITLPLLTTADGVKFGKSAGNAVFLSPHKTSVFDFYQYFVRVQDADVRKLLSILTLLPLDEIERVMQQHMEAPEKRLAQKVLARELTRAVHGEEELRKAERSAELLYSSSSSDSSVSSSSSSPSWSTLSKDDIKTLLKDAPSVSVSRSVAFDRPLVTVLKECGVCKSAGEARRMLQGGGVYVNNERIDSVHHVLDESKDVIDGHVVVVRLGKRNYHLLEIVDP